MASSEESLVGKELDRRYLVEQQLGGGGISVVYTARDQKVVGRKVVVKVLLKEWQQNEFILTKFRQEAEALSRVRHPNVVEVLDTGELSDGRPYIVLEFIEGDCLRSLITPAGCDLERSVRIIKQVGSALTAAHNKKVFHRDLKPENIMLRKLDDGEEQVKVIDFGIAKVGDSVLAPETQVVATAGTIAYMSPEQLSEARITAASDIYALGILAFELITGRKPFNPKTPYQLLEMQRAGLQLMADDSRQQLPFILHESFLKALAFDPNDRYTRARDFGDELFEIVTGMPVTPTVPLTEHKIRTAALNSRARSPHDATNAFATTRLPTPTGAARGGVSTAPTRSGSDAETNLMQPETFANPTTPAPAASNSKVWLILAGMLFFILLAGASAFVAWKFMQSRYGHSSTPPQTEQQQQQATTPDSPPAPAEQPASPASAPVALTYSLTVQRYLNGQKYKEPLESTGQDMFENGWQFRLNISSPNSGYLYLLNEGLNASGAKALTVLFPTGDSAALTANQKMQIPPPPEWYQFTGQTSAEPEKIWMVWAARPIPELEAVKDLIRSETEGEIVDPAQSASVREFLLRHATSKAALEKDSVNRQTHVRGSGDIIVSLAELEHR
ncbi:MAG TPA: protein kinase [Pyrinomonadaceae bacterium]|jgi:serine/threonine-protein kinase|nr:protein kinase [Pyrinomonadaceae bacterium]